MADTDTVAVLRDKVITYVATNRHPWSSAETVDLLIAAVRHEHGERIAKAVSELPLSRRVDAGRWSYTPAEIRENAARKALDLSPAPEDPRLYDPANDGALDAQMEADTDG